MEFAAEYKEDGKGRQVRVVTSKMARSLQSRGVPLYVVGGVMMYWGLITKTIFFGDKNNRS